ncbi:uncharacterized protein BDZ99DRAFT_264432 [Mytilinidion resinicola]|uniref:Transcription factor domain-containing protein n=1 Tax=Mytilinidion resinicola TaxID=574789 RepID=A0A6A6YU45_9PEZI|nr:uncharacterized protein BDZ99DRAFT_264432 [Mytilinidion resinicola]KAF2812301.1 hypothetical protein BDZ99DRAFT_264432 [Mytilinidion resinicola]
MHIASVLRDRMAQQPAPSMETLHAHGEAMRNVVETLQAVGRNVAQPTVFAVSNLATASVMSAEWDEAKRHLEALIRIVDLRGGVSTLDFELQRKITWASYGVSMVLEAPPSFPCPMFPSTRPFPLALTDDSSIRAWRTLKKMPKSSSFLYDLVLRLHQIGLATTSEFREDVNMQAVSNAYFESQHRLLLLNVEQPWMGKEGPVVRVPELEALYQVFDHAAQLFLCTTLRHVHTGDERWSVKANASLIRLIFSRIRAALSVESNYNVWARRRCLDPMVWVLVVCIESCGNVMPDRGWFLAELRKVLGIMKVKRIEEFRKTLAAFPATDGLQRVERGIWDSVSSQ